MRDTYDLVIVGAGPGGYVAARKAAGMGMSVALIDRGPVGGTCVNRGCIPAKALLHASTLYREMKSCERFGLHAEEVSFDLQEIYRYKDEAADRMRGELEEEFCRLGVDLIRGSAVICRDRMVRVTDEDGSVSVCQGKNILRSARLSGGHPGRGAARRHDKRGASYRGRTQVRPDADSGRRRHRSGAGHCLSVPWHGGDGGGNIRSPSTQYGPGVF